MLNRFIAATLISAVLAVPAFAQDRRAPNSAAELRLSYAPIVQRAQPAVVNVYAAKTVQNINPLLDDPIFRRFFGVPGNNRPEQMQRSLGSGVMVDPSGLVVTNNHVIEGADQVKISLADKREFEAEIVLKDSRTDLAVLRIKDGKEKFATLDFANSDELVVGDIVLAIGNPVGLSQTVTQGIVSATGRGQLGVATFENFIQTDAPINVGNSGGALINTNGELVGINTAVLAKNLGVEGIGFAIPVNLVRGVMGEILSKGRVIRGWIGIVPIDVDDMTARRNNLAQAGVVVVNLYEDSPAVDAGIELRDIILTVNGVKVQSAQDTLTRVANVKPGERVKITGLRATGPFATEVPVTERPRAN